MILSILIIFGGLCLGTTIVKLIDKKLGKISVRLPKAKYFIADGKVMQVHDVNRIGKRHSDIEGFENNMPPSFLTTPYQISQATSAKDASDVSSVPVRQNAVNQIAAISSLSNAARSSLGQSVSFPQASSIPLQATNQILPAIPPVLNAQTPAQNAVVSQSSPPVSATLPTTAASVNAILPFSSAVPTPNPTIVPPALLPPLPATTAPNASQMVPPVLASPTQLLSNPTTSAQQFLSNKVGTANSCLPSDKNSFVPAAGDNARCQIGDRSSFRGDTSKCSVNEKSRYDKNDPEKLRMELELLNMKRNEISSKLNLNLDSGYKIGCNSDRDCNALNQSPGGNKNVCKLDHTCSCESGGGPFCLEPASYKDPNEMTEDQRHRFKMQNDLSNFTKLDYVRWLQLYRDTPKLLSEDHVLNFQKIHRGGDFSLDEIPKIRESPPLSAKKYLDLLDSNTRIDYNNSDTAGPYLASNYNKYDMFMPPAELTNYRVINGDLFRKYANNDDTKLLRPMSDNPHKPRA